MARDDMEIVLQLQAKLVDRVGPQRYELWFEGVTKLRVAGNALTVEVPSAFHQDWMRKNFRPDLEAACWEVLDSKASVEFEVNTALAVAPAEQPPRKVRPAATGPDSAPPLAPDPVCETSLATQSDRVALRPRKLVTFDDFVAGDGSRIAFSSAQHAVARLGAVSPLFLHGSIGVGKTHLLEAIRAAAGQACPRPHAVYVTAEQFTTDFQEAIRGKGMPSFRRKYRGLDLLIVDDIHFLIGKKSTADELLHTTDALLRKGCQLVFAADRGPAELATLGSELAARLSGGLACLMEPPDYRTRLGIVAGMARRMQIDLPENVQAMVAEQVATHARDISGALNRLLATSLALGRPITESLAEDALAELSAAGARAVRLVDIQRAVCEEFGLEPDSLQSSRKAKVVAGARTLAMFLARKHTRAALSEISRFFGRSSHSTVISASKKVESWMSRRERLPLEEKACGVEEAIRRVEQRLKTA